jgi:hypothetical protein
MRTICFYLIETPLMILKMDWKELVKDRESFTEEKKRRVYISDLRHIFWFNICRANVLKSVIMEITGYSTR